MAFLRLVCVSKKINTNKIFINAVRLSVLAILTGKFHIMSFHIRFTSIAAISIINPIQTTFIKMWILFVILIIQLTKSIEVHFLIG